MSMSLSNGLLKHTKPCHAGKAEETVRGQWLSTGTMGMGVTGGLGTGKARFGCVWHTWEGTGVWAAGVAGKNWVGNLGCWAPNLSAKAG